MRKMVVSVIEHDGEKYYHAQGVDNYIEILTDLIDKQREDSRKGAYRDREEIKRLQQKVDDLEDTLSMGTEDNETEELYLGEY